MNARGSEERFFIVGFPRSGTTLLQRMLDAHPTIAVSPETQFMVRIWQKRDEFGDITCDEGWSALLSEVVDLPRFQEANYPADDFLACVADGPRDYTHLFDALIHYLAKPDDASLLGEKSPDHIRFIPQIISMFPGAIFVHIIRDPRAVLCSMIGLPWVMDGYRENALRWRARMKSMRNQPSDIKQRIITIRYEHLVRTPEQTLRTVCDFLHAPYDAGMLSYHEQKMQYYDPEREYWMRNPTKPVFTMSVDKWRDELTPAEIGTIESITWRETARCGYAVSLPPSKLVPSIHIEDTRYNAERVRYRVRKRMMERSRIPAYA